MARNQVVLVAVVVCILNLAEPTFAQVRRDGLSSSPPGPGYNQGRPVIPPSIPDRRHDDDNNFLRNDSIREGLRSATHSLVTHSASRPPSNVRLTPPSYKVPALPHGAPVLGRSKGVLAGIGTAIAGFFGWLFGRNKRE